MASNNKVLTIDITNESITIVEVTPSNKKQSTIHNAIIFETPEDAYEDGVIRDKERIAEAIKSQLSANGITNKNAIFVLTSTKMFLYLSLRRTKLKELLMRTHQSISLLI